jgi:hypothetical protein
MMAVPKLTGDRCLCGACGEFFNRASTFTAHRTGPFAPIGRPDTRRCLTVAEMQVRGWSRDAAGFWRPGASQSPARRRRIGETAAISPEGYPGPSPQSIDLWGP